MPRLTRASSEGVIEVPFDLEPRSDGSYTLHVRGSLDVGTQLTLDAAGPPCSAGQPLHTQFTLTAAQPTPAMLGTLRASITRAPLQVAVVSGSCSDVIDAVYADLTLDLALDALPLASVLRYELLVDDALAPGFASVFGDEEMPGAAGGRVYAVCQLPTAFVSPQSAVGPGMHRARLRGTLPDGTVLHSTEVAFELSCEGSAPAPGWEDLGAPFDRPTPGASMSEGADGGCSAARRGGVDSALPLLALATLLGARSRRTRCLRNVQSGHRPDV